MSISATACRMCWPPTANLLRVNGWRTGAPFGEGTQNFELMREWNHAEIYRRAMVLFAERLKE